MLNNLYPIFFKYIFLFFRQAFFISIQGRLLFPNADDDICISQIFIKMLETSISTKFIGRKLKHNKNFYINL